MKRTTLVLSLLALWPVAVIAANASGKTLVRQSQGQIVPISGSNVLANFPFTTPGCYASGSALGTKGQTVTVTRATVKQCETSSGVWTQCGNNAACVEASGLLVEPARYNYALNSATHPKTTEASGSLGTGAHIAWHAGTGTMTIAAGTATVTGLSCAGVAVGTSCTFTVTVAGTMAITTEAGATHVDASVLGIGR